MLVFMNQIVFITFFSNMIRNHYYTNIVEHLAKDKMLYAFHSLKFVKVIIIYVL